MTMAMAMTGSVRARHTTYEDAQPHGGQFTVSGLVRRFAGSRRRGRGLGRRGQHSAVPHLADRVDQFVDGVTVVETDVSALQGEVDLSRHALESVELAFDAGRAGPAGHAADIERDYGWCRRGSAGHDCGLLR
jgi:hypothetical protein